MGRHSSPETGPAGSSAEGARPALRILHGSPTAEELAALTAVVAAAGAPAVEPAAPPIRGRWNDPAHSLRASLPFGAGGWRAARTP